LDPDPGSRNGRQFAEFLDNKLTEELASQGSAGHQRTLRSRQLTEQKIQRIDEDVAKAQKKGNTAAVQKEVKAWGLDMTG
jgi:Rod binding domain-containing protein